MSVADLKYIELVKEIAEFGHSDIDQNVRTVWEDGEKAYTISLINRQLKFDNGSEIPLLTFKRVPLKDPLNELFWIWKYKSNDVQFLREELGCKVWDEWERSDRTIGKAYGWQLANKRRRVIVDKFLLDMIHNGEICYDGSIFALDEEIGITFLVDVEDILIGDEIELDQVDWLLYTLKNPLKRNSRRIKTTLWCFEDLDDMALEPCVYDTHWQMWNDKLNLTVNIRSNDIGLGNAYNIYQYAILHRMIAQVTGLEVGEICFNIDNAHIYDRHILPLLLQIEKECYEAPQVIINPDITSFYEFTIDDINVVNYQHSGNLKLEIAI